MTTLWWAKLWVSWKPNYCRLWFNPSNPQSIWLCTRQQLAKLDMVVIAADFPHFICPLLSGTLELRSKKPPSLFIYILSPSWFILPVLLLRQLRAVVRLLIPDAIATLIKALVTARLDHCCSFYASIAVGQLGGAWTGPCALKPPNLAMSSAVVYAGCTPPVPRPT